MLSILIPTYNQDITRLVSGLHRQAMDQYVDFEIIVFEDGSTSFVDTNKSICTKKNCRHIVSPENTGRSAARNRMADEALYNHLLFMDGDAELCSSHFIEKYLAFCHEECIVIGGTAYDPLENNPNFSLRLKYGRRREARSASKRSKNNFATFNFLISKSIFNKVRFDESIRGYGHEDMLFGHQLRTLEYEFIQIENPLIHAGLDDNTTFIKKTEEATRNLYLLYKTGRYPQLEEESTLLRKYLLFRKFGLNAPLAFVFEISAPLLKTLLRIHSPSLFVYDLYKLLFLCKTSLTK